MERCLESNQEFCKILITLMCMVLPIIMQCNMVKKRINRHLMLYADMVQNVSDPIGKGPL